MCRNHQDKFLSFVADPCGHKGTEHHRGNGLSRSSNSLILRKYGDEKAYVQEEERVHPVSHTSWS